MPPWPFRGPGGGPVKVFLIDEQLPEAAEPGHRAGPLPARAGPRRRQQPADCDGPQPFATSRRPPRSASYEGEQAGKARGLTPAAGRDGPHRPDPPLRGPPGYGPAGWRSSADALPGDNRYHLPMRIHDRKQILLVSPPAGERARGTQPGVQPSRGRPAGLRPQSRRGPGQGRRHRHHTSSAITPQRFGRVSLPIYSIIILYGVTELPEQSVQRLDGVRQNGGGVWLIPGRDMSPLRFNEAYAKLLGGFAIGQLKRPDQVQMLGRGEARHNAIRCSCRCCARNGATPATSISVNITVVQLAGGPRCRCGPATATRSPPWSPQERGLVFVQLYQRRAGGQLAAAHQRLCADGAAGDNGPAPPARRGTARHPARRRGPPHETCRSSAASRATCRWPGPARAASSR